MRRLILLLPICMALIWLLPAPALGLTPIANELQKLLASDGAPGEGFGRSVAASGHVAVIGAPDDGDNGDGSGSAYVYRHDGAIWMEEQKLLASDGGILDSFGRSVAVSGDVAVIGAPFDVDHDIRSGSAYVYRFDGTSWVEEQKLLASDGVHGDTFGRSVAVSGDVAVIGAAGDDDNGNNSGSAYVYRFDGASWIEAQKLLASDGATFHSFGLSVTVSGNVAVIGAHVPGWAYVYRFDGTGWVEEQKLQASDAAPGDFFGEALAVSGDVAVIGARLDDDNGKDSGSAYVYRFDGTSWVEEQKLLASDGVAGHSFGGSGSVAVSGEVAVIGAYRDYDNGSDAGSAYVYRFDGSSWVEEQKLLASDGAAHDRFGRRVAVSGDMAVIGALGDDDNGPEAGSAYVYAVGTSIEIDIMPGSNVNPINLGSRGLIPVAILGSESFDVADVGDDLFFGPGDAELAHRNGPHLEDVNEDGFTDLVAHFRTRETGIEVGHDEACLRGELVDDTSFEACDAVLTFVPCGIGFELAVLLPPLVWLQRRRRRARLNDIATGA